MTNSNSYKFLSPTRIRLVITRSWRKSFHKLQENLIWKKKINKKKKESPPEFHKLSVINLFINQYRRRAAHCKLE